MKKLLLYCTVAFISIAGRSQTTFPGNGVPDDRPSTYAFTNATIFQDYQTRLEKATLLIRDGRVVAVGTQVSIPAGTPTYDLRGRYIYPAFIDPYTSYGLPEAKSGGGGFGAPQYETRREGAYGWNESIKADYNASGEFSVDPKAATELRKNGFGAVVSFRPDGIMRGSSVVAATGEGPVQEMVLNAKASAHLSFDKGTARQLYPNSIMGMVALIRQSYYDADWYARGGSNEQLNQSLEAIHALKGLPQVFEANNDKLRVLLADKVGDEFGLQYVIKGNGDEYQRVAEIKSTGAPLIIPVNFPKAYEVDDPLDALEISLSDLKHWELAPTNPSTLARNNIEFAFTSAGLKDRAEYLKNIRKSIQYGLSEEQALKAMTYTPARLVRMQREIGSLTQGMRANFVIASGNLFDEDTQLYETWVMGSRYEVVPMDVPDLSGQYTLRVGNTSYQMEVSGQTGKQKAKLVINDSTTVDVDIRVDEAAVRLVFTTKEPAGLVRLSGWSAGDRLWKGTGIGQDGSWISWEATYTGELEKKEEKKKDGSRTIPEVGQMIYPFVAYGWVDKPVQETILFKNATVWTMEAAGKIEGADVLVQGGKISKVGKNLSAPANARIVDASGKHLTPGIIDEHSHAALSGVNEATHSITAEVRMYDAVNSEDTDIYRQLAGGVTAAQMLHGSANPVGGQSALLKYRWGASPDQLRIEGADDYIKFALGENVKQSNRSGSWTERFPQTRMGVEQVFVDGFTRAKAYDQSWKAYNGLAAKVKATTLPPRRDLQLETLAQILNGQRFISCHSYVQSEINMLMKVAEQFSFRVNTFTHILEGYKVADKMAAHGAGGSTFSDWWAYKYEVKEAIPYNAALMAQAGVTVSINSDDAEMARRLNQEAGKTIKYGDVDEWEAMKMVTINPARLLHLDDRMGSIRAGKDADLVLWSAHPLSIYAISEMTLVDGVAYFDKQKDAKMREWIREERTRIITKMKEEKKGGGATQAYKPKEKHRWDCEEFADELINE